MITSSNRIDSGDLAVEIALRPPPAIRGRRCCGQVVANGSVCTGSQHRPDPTRWHARRLDESGPLVSIECRHYARSMRMRIGSKLGRLAWCLVIAVGAACTAAEDEGSSPTISQRPRSSGSPAERTDLQLRSVIAIVRPSSPEWSDMRPTCPAHGDDVGACIGSAPDEEEIVILGPGKGLRKYVLGAVIVDEQDVQRAEAHQQQQADLGWSVSVSLTDDAASAFRAATEAAVDALAPQNQIAIIVDSRIVSSPTVVVPITSGSLVLTGRFTRRKRRHWRLV